MKGRIITAAAVLALLLCGLSCMDQESDASDFGGNRVYSYVYDSTEKILYMNIAVSTVDQYDITIDLVDDLSGETLSRSGLDEYYFDYEIDGNGNLHIYGPVSYSYGLTYLTGESFTAMIEFVPYLPVMTESGNFSVTAYPGTIGVINYRSAYCLSLDPELCFFSKTSDFVRYGFVIHTDLESGIFGNGSYSEHDSSMTFSLWINYESSDDAPYVSEILMESISIYGGNSVNAGEWTQLSLGISPSDATYPFIVWSSSNTSVATVDQDGIVTGVAVGTVTITATADDGSEVYGTKTIAVNEALTQPSSGSGTQSDPYIFNLTKGEASILRIANLGPFTAFYAVGSNITIPGMTFTYGSWSGSTLPTSGKQAQMSALIIGGTPTSTGSWSMYGLYSSTTTYYKFVVTSASPETDTTDVIISGSSHYVKIGGQLALTASVLPSTAAQSVKWSSSNTANATVSSSGVVTGKANGTVTITATADDGSGISGTYQITVVSISLSAPTYCVVGERLNATASANAGTIVWSVSDTTKASVSGNTITILSIGSFSVIVTETNSGSVSSMTVTAYSKLCFSDPTNGVIIQC